MRSETAYKFSQAAKLYEAKKQMASVFGVPISVDTLKATALYEEPITQKDLADYAMMMMNDGRDAEAREFLDKLKERFVYGLSSCCNIKIRASLDGLN